jgi:hypothetical protein
VVWLEGAGHFFKRYSRRMNEAFSVNLIHLTQLRCARLLIITQQKRELCEQQAKHSGLLVRNHSFKMTDLDLRGN